MAIGVAANAAASSVESMGAGDEILPLLRVSWSSDTRRGVRRASDIRKECLVLTITGCVQVLMMWKMESSRWLQSGQGR